VESSAACARAHPEAIERKLKSQDVTPLIFLYEAWDKRNLADEWRGKLKEAQDLAKFKNADQ
jgi:hypothetical protein